MAEAKKGEDAPVPVQAYVGVSAALRKTFQWFEEAAKAVKEKALADKKKELLKPKKPKKGERTKPIKPMSEQRLQTAWKLLRKLEPRIEALQKRCKAVRESLARHYALMSEEKWEKDGETLAWPSYKLGINQAAVESKLHPESWARLSQRILEVELFLALITAERVESFKDAKGKNITMDELLKIVRENVVVMESPSITVAAPKPKMPIAEALQKVA